MNNQLLQIKFEQRLNKLSSSDFGNIECWMIAEAFNKSQPEWVGRQLEGINQTKTGSEGSMRRIDDLQKILTTWTDTFVDKGLYYESTSFPDNYMGWSRLSTDIFKKCCPPRKAVVYLVQEANIDIILKDSNEQPNYEWAETVGTLIDNKIRIYTNGEFEVQSPRLTYFREPRAVVFANCTDPNTGNPSLVDIECEFPDRVIELIIDDAVAILAGDMDNFSKMQIFKNNAEHNN